jgi:hypothetical protein
MTGTATPAAVDVLVDAPQRAVILRALPRPPDIPGALPEDFGDGFFDRPELTDSWDAA